MCLDTARCCAEDDEANQADAAAPAGEFPQLHKIVGEKIVRRWDMQNLGLRASTQEGDGPVLEVKIASCVRQ